MRGRMPVGKMRMRISCDIETSGEHLVDARRLRLLVEEHVSLALLQLCDEVAVDRVEIGRMRPEGVDLLPFRKRQDA
jgi:hypothetical protein